MHRVRSVSCTIGGAQLGTPSGSHTIRANAASASGSQKVMSMARYSAMAVERAVRACSRWPVVAYRVPSPR